MGYQVQSRRRRRSLRPSGDEATRKFRVSRLKGLGFTVGDWGFRLKGSGVRAVRGLGGSRDSRVYPKGPNKLGNLKIEGF